MSTSYGFKCKTCGATSNFSANGTHSLEEAYEKRHALASLVDECMWIEVSLLGTYEDEISFLKQHKDHEMCLVNIYGEEYELPQDDTPKVTHKLRIFRELQSADGLKGGLSEVPNDVPRTVHTVVHRNVNSMSWTPNMPTLDDVEQSRQYEFAGEQMAMIRIYKEKV